MSFISFNAFANQFQPPYNIEHILPEYNFGYYSNQNSIEEIFKNNDIRTVIEIGSWVGGGSSKHFATLLKQKHGKLYAVDTWLGSSEHQIGQAYWQPVLSYVYEQFLSNMIHWNFTDTVIPCRMKSTDASQLLNVNPDLIYIDGAHETEAVYDDLCHWFPHVKGRGILCGDDWGWKSVQKAVIRFASENHLFIDAPGYFWRLYEVDDFKMSNFKEQLLIHHLKHCLTLGSVEESKLKNDILHIEGMSSPKVRHFLNNLCTLPNSNYLEIGIWKGSTFISALYGNQNNINNAIGIDNWSQFGAPFDEFQNNIQKYVKDNKYEVFSVDCLAFNLKNITQPINVFFYDGDPSENSLEAAFAYYNEVFDDIFIVIVDDWNFSQVQKGTYSAFRKLNYEILFEQIMPAYGNWDFENWWNGLYVAVIKKRI